MADNSPPNRGRRKALKTIGVGMIAMSGPMIGSTAANSDENVVISIQRDRSNGIDTNEYNKLVSQFTQAAKAKAGLNELAVAKPELSAGEKIYSLTFIATPEGNAQTYLGTGTNPGDAELERLHNRSLQFQKQASVESTGDGLSTQQSDPSYEWAQVGSALWEKTDSPHGIVQNSSEMWHYTDDPNYDVFAATVDATFEPGKKAYDSAFFWDSALVRHYWGRNYEPGGANLTKWAPNGDRTGDKTVTASISYSGASIEVSYNPPKVRRTDNTGLTNDNVRIKWKPGDSNSPGDIFQSSVASIMKSKDHASPGDTLAQTDTTYHVTDYWRTDHTISAALTLEYES